MKPHRTTILILAIIASVLALPLVAAAPAENVYQHPEACTIMTFNGFLDDSDCDGIHDAVDNCPMTPNAPQYDGNRDGVGDACDLIIEEIVIEPSILVQANEFFKLNVLLVNNQRSPIHDVDIRVQNADLEFNVVTPIPIIEAGQARNLEFLLKIPPCTLEKTYTLQVETRYLFEGAEHTHVKQQQVRVVPGGVCTHDFTLMENTIVETFSLQEIDVGERTIIPIRIVNLNEDAVSYDIRLEGFNHWGTYRIDPTPEFTLASGHDTTTYLAIELENWADLGDHEMRVVVRANNDEEDAFPIVLRVRKPITVSRTEQLKHALEVALILVLIALLIVGFVIAYKKMNEEDPDKIETQPQTTKEVLKKEGIDHAEAEK